MAQYSKCGQARMGASGPLRSALLRLRPAVADWACGLRTAVQRAPGGADVLHMGPKPHIYECDIFLQYVTPYVQYDSVGGHHGHRRGRTSQLADAIALVPLCRAHVAWQGSPLPPMH